MEFIIINLCNITINFGEKYEMVNDYFIYGIKTFRYLVICKNYLCICIIYYQINL